MTPMTATEKILSAHAGKKSVAPGDAVWIDVDILLTHDICGPGTIGIFKKEFGPDAAVWDPGKVVVIPDHYIFTRDAHAARNLEILRAFARDQGLPHFFDAGTGRYKGVCHVALAEEGFAVPGQVLFGTDSHTCTAGAFGGFASGIGNTDAAFVMGTGFLWVKVPATRRVVLEGELPLFVMAKDVVLHLLGAIGVEGANYQTVEYSGDGVSVMSMDERMTLCNMAVEAGAKNGIVSADEKTAAFLRGKTDRPVEPVWSDDGAAVAGVHAVRCTALEPMVAQPYAPSNAVPARTLGQVRLDQCYVGSCTGGKITDLVAAARILKGHRVKVRTVVVPATKQVEAAMDVERIDGVDLRTVFLESGAEIGPPSCAACLGGPDDTFGRLKGNEVNISTTNRNFPGRMGSLGSRTYLASPLTVAVSALGGRITDPRDFM